MFQALSKSVDPGMAGPTAKKSSEVTGVGKHSLNVFNRLPLSMNGRVPDANDRPSQYREHTIGITVKRFPRHSLAVSPQNSDKDVKLDGLGAVPFLPLTHEWEPFLGKIVATALELLLQRIQNTVLYLVGKDCSELGVGRAAV